MLYWAQNIVLKLLFWNYWRFRTEQESVLVFVLWSSTVTGTIGACVNVELTLFPSPVVVTSQYPADCICIATNCWHTALSRFSLICLRRFGFIAPLPGRRYRFMRLKLAHCATGYSARRRAVQVLVRPATILWCLRGRAGGRTGGH